MRLTVIGSSDAFNAAGRGHSCYWIEGLAGAPVMVDFGATALAALKRQGFDPRQMKGVLITHLHGDHIGGLPYLLIDGMFNLTRPEPLRVLGPVGTRARLEALFEANYAELRPCEYEVEELLPGEETTFLGLNVQGFAAQHMPLPDRPLILRVSGVGGRVVAFSGDTAMCQELLAAQEESDLFVAECTGMQRPAGRHCTWEEWRQVIHRVSSQRMLLTHLNETVRQQKGVVLAERPADLWLELADDGMVVEF